LTQQLRLHHVELTEAGLTKALQSPNEQVRYLAALRLAEEKDMDAVPAIAEALSQEKVPETRVNIAIALAQLGEDRGIGELKVTCGDSALPGYLRVRAMIYFVQSGKRACLRSALDMLSSDPGSRQQIVSLLPQFPHPSKEESDEILEAITKCLSDESGVVRIQASDALKALANPSAIPSLQNAIATEQDDVVRSSMESALEALQTKKQQ
jgi:HEAT repeat protein